MSSLGISRDTPTLRLTSRHSPELQYWEPKANDCGSAEKRSPVESLVNDMWRRSKRWGDHRLHPNCRSDRPRLPRTSAHPPLSEEPTADFHLCTQADVHADTIPRIACVQLGVHSHTDATQDQMTLRTANPSRAYEISTPQPKPYDTVRDYMERSRSTHLCVYPDTHPTRLMTCTLRSDHLFIAPTTLGLG